MTLHVPKDHPRYESIRTRERLIEAVDAAVLAPAGLIAHGRGEAFDYLLGEESPPAAVKAVSAAARMLLSARSPVLSVNGNAAALTAKQLVEISQLSGAPLEINLFYRSAERERAIERVLKDAGGGEILGIGSAASERVPEIGSERRRIDPRGIGAADLVFVPLEDGDRTEGLKRMGKRVITVDLNPLSRTAQKADLTIVDNLTRCMPLLVEELRRLVEAGAASDSANSTEEIKTETPFDNRKNLQESIAYITRRLALLAEEQNEDH
jgi:4-phosphopantoate---beta-alanine ligase